MTRKVLALAVATLIAVPAVGRAQSDTGQRPPPPQGMMGGRQGRGQGGQRMRFQREIRQAFTRAVRTQVGLNEDQMKQLVPINRKYVHERQQLGREEREVRMALGRELEKASPNQDSVAALSNRLQDFARRRLDLNDAEDKDLGGIMTPVQLAKYRALQERVQRRINMMRPPMMGGDRPPPPPPDSEGRSLEW